MHCLRRYQKLHFRFSYLQFFPTLLHYQSYNLNIFKFPLVLDKRFGYHQTDYQDLSPTGKHCFMLLLKSFRVSFCPIQLEFWELWPPCQLCYENENDWFLNRLIRSITDYQLIHSSYSYSFSFQIFWWPIFGYYLVVIFCLLKC